MTIKTRISFRQYLKLIYGLTYRRPLLLAILGVAVILLLWIAFYYLGLFNLPKPIIYQYLTLSLILVAQPIVIFTTTWRNYYSSNHLRETLEMAFSLKKIKISGDSFYLELEWEKLFRIREQNNYFLIYQNNLSAIIVPKKSFKTKKACEQFKSMLKEIKGVPIDLKN